MPEALRETVNIVYKVGLEVEEEAAIKVDPHDTESLASAFHEVLTNEHLKGELVSKGLE